MIPPLSQVRFDTPPARRDRPQRTAMCDAFTSPFELRASHVGDSAESPPRLAPLGFAWKLATRTRNGSRANARRAAKRAWRGPASGHRDPPPPTTLGPSRTRRLRVQRE